MPRRCLAIPEKKLPEQPGYKSKIGRKTYLSQTRNQPQPPSPLFLHPPRPLLPLPLLHLLNPLPLLSHQPHLPLHLSLPLLPLQPQKTLIKILLISISSNPILTTPKLPTPPTRKLPIPSSPIKTLRNGIGSARCFGFFDTCYYFFFCEEFGNEDGFPS